jgi:hypothetical protein
MDQGKLWGAVASLSSLTAILGPLLYTQTFSLIVSGHLNLPIGTTYFVSAGLALLGVLIMGTANLQNTGSDIRN